MTCDKHLLVHALADGELDVVHAREMETHIDGCADCAATLANITAMKERLASPELRLRAPAALAARIAGLVAPTAASEPVAVPAVVVPLRQRRTWTLRAQGALVGAALAMAASLAVVLPRANLDEGIARSLVDGHLRSLAGEHLIDVVSTDQHTVKPWFAGKLDVTPPVPDLALKGFTLVGGRVDYVGGRAAAVVVYRRRIHVINLFVWPGETGAPPTVELRGFNLRHWTKEGLTFWAVSDLNEAELGEFEMAFKAAS